MPKKKNQKDPRFWYYELLLQREEYFLEYLGDEDDDEEACDTLTGIVYARDISEAFQKIKEFYGREETQNMYGYESYEILKIGPYSFPEGIKDVIV